MRDDTVYPPVDELEKGEDGFLIPPDGIRVYENGAGARRDGKIVYPPHTFRRTMNTLFTPETSKLAVEARRTKAQEEIRKQIEALEGLPFDEAFGKMGGRLWREVAGNENERGGVRVNAWKEIATIAGAIEDTDLNKGASIKVDNITPEIAHEMRLLIAEIRAGRLQPEDNQD